ncbi:MAG: magnesium and cobalt transport protein CorA [Anaerolineaceae bacterium 4572_78]|nr:MAG: magnesium and cobalt transport protein CorA [Anaerolineaceae bacterium 4572_78]
MIHSLFYQKDGTIRRNLTLIEIEQAYKSSEGVLWVSLEDPIAEEIHGLLHDIFQFHPLTIEDCENIGYQAPKIDVFGDYLFLIMHAIQPGFLVDKLNIELNMMELNCYLGQNYLITSYRSSEMPCIEKVRKQLELNPIILEQGADFLCYTILDVMINKYIPIIDAMENKMDTLEDEVLSNPRQDVLQNILDLKRSVQTLRRITSPQRDVINHLSLGTFPQIKNRSQIYFRDIYDQLVRLHQLGEEIQEMATSTIDIYLTITSNNMNEVMKILTIFSTIFLPLSFLAGIYGMNFKYLPEVEWQYGYFILWVVFIGISGGMLGYFKKKKWF